MKVKSVFCVVLFLKRSAEDKQYVRILFVQDEVLRGRCATESECLGRRGSSVGTAGAWNFFQVCLRLVFFSFYYTYIHTYIRVQEEAGGLLSGECVCVVCAGASRSAERGG